MMSYMLDSITVVLSRMRLKCIIVPQNTVEKEKESHKRRLRSGATVVDMA